MNNVTQRYIQVGLVTKVSIGFSFFQNEQSNMEQYQILNKGIGGKEHELISTNKSFKNSESSVLGANQSVVSFLFEM